MLANLESLVVARRLEKIKSSFQSQRRATPKNAQVTAQLCSPHTPARLCSQSCKPGFNGMCTRNYQTHSGMCTRNYQTHSGMCTRNYQTHSGMCTRNYQTHKLGFKEAEGPDYWIMEKARELKKNIYFCFIHDANIFDCMDHNSYGKFLKRWEYQTTFSCLLRNLYAKN